MEPKQTRIYSNENKRKCVVSLYKEYISHRPETNGAPGHSAFYLACRPNPNDAIWYKAAPLGLHSLSSATKQSHMLNYRPFLQTQVFAEPQKII